MLKNTHSKNKSVMIIRFFFSSPNSIYFMLESVKHEFCLSECQLELISFFSYPSHFNLSRNILLTYFDEIMDTNLAGKQCSR